jgi:hypothetical protein
MQKVSESTPAGSSADFSFLSPLTKSKLFVYTNISLDRSIHIIGRLLVLLMQVGHHRHKSNSCPHIVEFADTVKLANCCRNVSFEIGKMLGNTPRSGRADKYHDIL